MATTLGLVVGILTLLIVLEILNALYDAVVEGLATDLKRGGPRTLLLALPTFLAGVVGVVSLMIHELSHALAQLVFGGRPSITLLKNGGFARSTPWLGWGPARGVHTLGLGLGAGVAALAPLLVSAAILVGALVVLSPMTGDTVLAAGRALAAAGDTAGVLDVVRGLWHLVAAMPWWGWPLLILLGLVLAPAMTPSTVDYVLGTPSIAGYALATLGVSAILAHRPAALPYAGLAALVLGTAGMLRGPLWVRLFAGGLGLGGGVLAIVLWQLGKHTDHTALGALHGALGVVALGLGVAGVVLAGFVVGFLALSLISLRPRTLWTVARAVPHHLHDLVRPFHTCEPCGVHYRGACDKCGRTPSGPAPAAPATPAAPRGLLGILERARIATKTE